MKSILFISTVYRTGEKVYPIIKPLSEKYEIDVMAMYQMSRNTPWNTSNDPRQKFYRDCQLVCKRVSHGPKYTKDNDENCRLNSQFFAEKESVLSLTNYNLVIVDNNVTIKGSEGSTWYKWFKNNEKTN